MIPEFAARDHRAYRAPRRDAGLRHPDRERQVPVAATSSSTTASSSPSTTTSSTRAASWTSGCARRGCSSTARAPAPTSRALRGESEPLSGGGRVERPDELPQDRRPRRRRHQVGGTTRRAAKMVFLDLDHPDIEKFVNWKVDRGAEGRRAGHRLAARRAAPQRDHRRLPRPTADGERHGRQRFDPRQNRALRKAIARRPRRAGPRELHPPRASSSRKQGFTQHRVRRATTPTGTPRPTPPSPARTPTTRCASPTTSSRRSIDDGDWDLHRAAPTARSRRTVRARELWDRDRLRRVVAAPIPGLQFDTTINEWHTCPADGRINATQSRAREYMFLDDTACNLASLNLMKFLDAETARVRHRGLPPRRAGSGPSCSRSRVLMAQFPSRADRRSSATSSARSASATPTSARC